MNIIIITTPQKDGRDNGAALCIEVNMALGSDDGCDDGATLGFDEGVELGIIFGLFGARLRLGQVLGVGVASTVKVSEA